ncbi:hypothetical protein OWR28_19450 [Chryseobacterium sp. 1B4]
MYVVINYEEAASWDIGFFLAAYVILCVGIYFYQEKIIFYPEKLPENYKFTFDGDFDEIPIKTQDGKHLSSVLFRAQNPKGVIFIFTETEGQ